MVERKQEGLRPFEDGATPAAAEVLAVFAGAAADDLDREPTAAFPQRRFHRFGDATPLRRVQHDAIEDHRDRLSLAEIRRRRTGEVEDVAVDPDAREAPPGEIRPELRRREAGGSVRQGGVNRIDAIGGKASAHLANHFIRGSLKID